jgi:integrase
MASLWKHPESKYWVACFTDRAGRRLKRSTKETDRKEAQRLADEYESAARRLRTAQQARAVIASIYERITGEDLPTVTTRAYVAKWLEEKGPEVSSRTLDFYRQTTDRFLEFLAADADKPIEFITGERLMRFRNDQARQISAVTTNHNLKCIRMLFKAAKMAGFLSENPAEAVSPVKERKTDKARAFHLTELQALIAAADDEWKSMIRFGLYTGQRLGDLALLTWRAVDLQKGEVRFLTKKTGRHITIPLAPPLRAHIEELPAGDDPNAPLHPRAFETMKRIGRVGSLSKEFGDLLVKAGIREEREEVPKAERKDRKRVRYDVSFHSLRATATTLLHEAGIPSSVAQELIGHDSEEVHSTYVRVGREALEKAAKVFPKV